MDYQAGGGGGKKPKKSVPWGAIGFIALASACGGAVRGMLQGSDIILGGWAQLAAGFAIAAIIWGVGWGVIRLVRIVGKIKLSGSVRLWIAATVVWVAYCLFTAEWNCFSGDSLYRYCEYSESAVTMIAKAVLIPVAALAGLFVIRWIIAGFRPAKNSN